MLPRCCWNKWLAFPEDLMKSRWHGMKKYVVIALAGLVGGCTTYWSHPVKSDLELVHDAAYCEALGGAAAHGMMSDKYWLMFVDVAREVTKQQVLQYCMERRGWARADSGAATQAQ
jgi:hypothetical protein